MAIITKPTSIQKNTPAEFTLDKAALAAVPSVSANAWYGDTNHWKTVTLNYMSVQYGEMLFVKFDATQLSPTGTWLAPSICQDIFEIVSISITDFANGTFRVPYTELNPSEFQVDMSPAPSTGYRYYKIAAQNSFSSNSGTAPTNAFSITEFQLKWGGIAQSMVGYTCTQLCPTIFGYPFSAINDGSTVQHWGEPASTTSYVDMFSVDLGTVRDVTAILFAPRYDGATMYNIPNQFKVYGSNDNSSWTLLYSHDDPASYSNWSPNVFTEFLFSDVTENVVFTDPLGVDTYTINGNSVSKASGPEISGGVAYHSSIRSQQSFSGDGYVEWTNDTANPSSFYIAGLCKNPRGAGISYFEFFINKGSGEYGMWAGGSVVATSSGTAVGDVLRVEKSGPYIKFYKNYSLVYTYNLGADSSQYFLETSFYNIGVGISNAIINGNLV